MTYEASAVIEQPPPKPKSKARVFGRALLATTGLSLVATPFVLSHGASPEAKGHHASTHSSSPEIDPMEPIQTQEMSALEAAATAQKVIDYVTAVDKAAKVQAIIDYVNAKAAEDFAAQQQSTTTSGGASYAHWMAIHECEQPESTGGWTAQDANYGGGLGIANSTWQQWGGTEFAPLPSQATPDEQITIANRIYTDLGSDPWGCKTSIP